MCRRKATTYSAANIWSVSYRPFIKQRCYVDYVLVNNKYQMDSIFPSTDSENRAICVPGVGSTKPFSAFISSTMPDLHFIAFGQCFPRYRYPKAAGDQTTLPDETLTRTRIDNVSDTALAAFQQHYSDDEITKDAVFDYVYGILHAPDYRERFANDLAKELPRIPMAPDFHAFAGAGPRRSPGSTSSMKPATSIRSRPT